MLRAVRDRFPQLTLHIDCNSGYRLSDLDMFRAIDELGLAMIEQPLAHDDVVDHAELQREIRTPVCLDESVSSVRHAQLAIQLGSCRMMNIKPGRVGGLTNAVEIHHRCRAAGIPCWVGGMLESAVGAAHCVALCLRFRSVALATARCANARVRVLSHNHLKRRRVRMQELSGGALK